MQRHFMRLLERKWSEGKFLCVGLDFNPKELPKELTDRYDSTFDLIFGYNQQIINTTIDVAAAYKPNRAFYARFGHVGVTALQQTIRTINRLDPEMPVILDAKEGDIANTNSGYIDEAFDEVYEADALTVHPYLGMEANRPFLEQKNKGVIVLAKTSNPGSGEFQDLPQPPVGEPLYLKVAKSVAANWNFNGNCMVVVGATYPSDLEYVRKSIGDMPILIPGIGRQGGDLEKSVHHGKNSRGNGFLINISRDIMYAYQLPNLVQSKMAPGEAAGIMADWYHQEIKKFLGQPV